MNFTFSHP